MTHEPNGKATVNLVVAILTVIIAIFTAIIGTVGVVIAIATPLVLMYSKMNAIEVQYSERLREVETQFRAADEFRNINLAGQMRFNGLLWQQSFGSPFPQEVYFPSIAKSL